MCCQDTRFPEKLIKLLVNLGALHRYSCLQGQIQFILLVLNQSKHNGLQTFFLLLFFVFLSQLVYFMLAHANAVHSEIGTVQFSSSVSEALAGKCEPDMNAQSHPIYCMQRCLPIKYFFLHLLFILKIESRLYSQGSFVRSDIDVQAAVINSNFWVSANRRQAIKFSSIALPGRLKKVQIVHLVLIGEAHK